jgi:PKD repeat protein
MKQFTQLLLITFFPFFVFSQTTEDKEEITRDYNTGQLKELAETYKSMAEFEKQKALELAAQKGWFIRKDENGILYELMRVSEEGNPLYYATNNINAAKSTRANTMHNGGILGLNVEGQNMTAHVWDGGLARSTHQEYDGIGGSNRFSIGDGTSALHYHSAHVTGTIMASGYSPNAKGMAPQADAVGYDWDYDASEATTAASNGMLLSNHSYGWGASGIPDWYFGAYNFESREWDVIMSAAPYYLMVCSAGNDGNDNSSNGDPLNGNASYDKLSGFKTTKNNMVVANGNDASIDASGNLISVVISSSSSEGPTDDYRIKPDITGNGTSLYSSYEGSDSEYGTISGTSMASPNVCGTLLLLQQHYNNLNGSFMRAATLKGLALHTADDAGPSGPDVVYGWGLLNAKAAANAITNNGVESAISELSLSQGSSYSMDVQSDGVSSLIASISWTDPAGPENTGTSNDNTPVLVNDLDIRVTKSGSTYYPYRLTSITTNGTGDNVVDPFEKVIVSGATGIYTITVTHKGSLSGGNQNFTLIVTGKSGLAAAPVANFSVSDLTPDVGQTVTFTDASTNVPTSWAWSVSPTTVTYINGTTSASQNPQVQFNAAGLYTITLLATNTYGSDTEVKTNYIDVIHTIPPYVDGFESLASGNYVAVTSPYWTTWSDLPGSTEDAVIVTSPTHGGTKAVKIDGLNDLVLPLGDKTSGKYELSFYMYVPSGYFGYYNLLQFFNGTSSEWGAEIFFNTGGGGYGNAGGSDSFTFTYGYNTWNFIKNVIDLDNDLAQIWMNGSLLHQWQWSVGALGDGTLNQLGGLDMYAWNVNGTPLYYFDDISYFETTQLDMTVFLEGPFNGTSMVPDLYSSLPLAQPYNASPWNYNGTESVTVIPNTSVVDWILVELRDATSASQANSGTVIAKQAAFLLSNGKVAGLDGSSILRIETPVFNNLFTVVHHRNHISVMSATGLTKTGGVYSYNFSTASSQAYGGTAAHKDLGTGVWGMFGGNGDGNGMVDDDDENPVWEIHSGTTGYLQSDYNFDTQSDNKDKDDIWAPNFGEGTQVPN